MLGNLFGNKQKFQKFRRTYGLTDFGLLSTSTDIALPAGAWTKFGSLTVPAKQQVTFGANDATGGVSAAGAPVYLRIDDSSGQITGGKVRFAITNANETNTVVVLEESLSRLSASSTGDRTIAVLLPEYPIKAQEDSKLQLLVYVDAATTLDCSDADNKATIPVTVYQ